MRDLTPSIPRRLPPIAQRLGDMDTPHPFAPRQVSDRPRDAQDAGITTRREPHRLGRLGKQLAPGLIRCRHRLQQHAVDLGVGADRVIGIAVRLQRPRRRNPGRHLGRTLGRRRQDQVGCQTR